MTWEPLTWSATYGPERRVLTLLDHAGEPQGHLTAPESESGSAPLIDRATTWFDNQQLRAAHDAGGAAPVGIPLGLRLPDGSE